MRTQENANDTANGVDDELLTKRELAPKLKRSIRTCDAWMRQGKLPYYKLGKSVLFRWSDVVKQLAKYRVN